MDPTVLVYPFGDRSYVSTLYYGEDVRTSLLLLKEKSVQCVVTSPPYWGLRDYGTGGWEGGDPGCDHKKVRDPTQAVSSSTLEGGKKTTGHLQEGYKSVCGRCGAARVDRQVGMEKTPEEFVETLVGVFREVRRVLRDDGVVWLNLGDSYASGGMGGHKGHKEDSSFHGHKGYRQIGGAKKPPPGLKPKDLVGIPWRVALALQADGWYLRSDIVWSKKNSMPEAVTDRPTRCHESVFLLSKQERYFYDQDAIKEPLLHPHAKGTFGTKHVHSKNPQYSHSGRDYTPPEAKNKRTVWDEEECLATLREGLTREERSHVVGPFLVDSQVVIPARDVPPDLWDYFVLLPEQGMTSVLNVNPRSYRGAHFATFPPKLVEPCILAGTSEKGACPTCGSPWLRVVEKQTVRDVAEVRHMPKTKLNVSRAGWRDPANAPKTTMKGWVQGCNCPPSDPVPCVVLDPFSGSATTGYVANRSGRDYVGIDLNAKYLDLAKSRLTGQEPPPLDQEEGVDPSSVLDMFE